MGYKNTSHHKLVSQKIGNILYFSTYSLICSMWKFSSKHLFRVFFFKENKNLWCKFDPFMTGLTACISPCKLNLRGIILNSPYELNLFRQTYDLIPHLFLFIASNKKKSNPAPLGTWRSLIMVVIWWDQLQVTERTSHFHDQ